MTDTLKDRVRAANPPFEGARRRYEMPDEARAACHLVGHEWAKEHGEPVAASITKACSAYWELFDERKKK